MNAFSINNNNKTIATVFVFANVLKIISNLMYFVNIHHRQSLIENSFLAYM